MFVGGDEGESLFCPLCVDALALRGEDAGGREEEGCVEGDEGNDFLEEEGDDDEWNDPLEKDMRE